MKIVNYSRFNAKTGKDKIFTKNVVRAKEYNKRERDILLENGQTLCVGITRTELYGKSGNYIAIVELL